MLSSVLQGKKSFCCLLLSRWLGGSAKRTSKTTKNSTSLSQTPESKIRNIGILAHIDAGKTTTSESMLFTCGVTGHLGKVDSGDTVMDYLPQERQRGITINSAVISFPWKDFRLNLIDTPGHVDFTVEVERCLLAMDGVVIILDAAKGVQAQTLTVWAQAAKFRLPTIIYLNKMDKPGANVQRCLEQLRSKLKIIPLPLQFASGEGRAFSPKDIATSTDSKLREQLLEVLADQDDDFAQLYLNNPSSLDSATIDSMIRQCCISSQVSPLLMGSSVHNTGVTQLLDAITKYLPDPLSITKPIVSDRLASTTGLYGLAFKNVHDKQRGLLTFLRLYRGNIKPGISLYNVNRNHREKVGKVMEAYADELKDIPEATEGNIVVVSGLTQTITGDTLVGSTHGNDEDAMNLVPILHIPDPVYFCSIEAGSMSQQQALEDALNIIQKEDPSLKVTFDPEVGQLVVSGMGELHLEILRERLKEQFKLEVYMGALQVAYKESPSISTDYHHHLVRELSGTQQSVSVHLRLIPSSGADVFKRLKIIPSQDIDWSAVPKTVLHATENGVTAGLSNGILMGCPVINVRVELLQLSFSRGTQLALVALAATQCVQELLRNSQCQILEPLMSLAITVPMDLVHNVLADLSKRRAQIKEIEVVDEETRCVVAETPLAEMMHFSRDMRTTTHGMATMDVQFGHYEPVGSEQYDKLQHRFV